MDDLAVRVEGLYKQYFVGKDYEGFLSKPKQDSSNNSFTGKSSHKQKSFWALQDISFEVKKGEVFGIIGANGAGKSTLLKVLSGITSPTKGYAKINGRVTSLLEVGTGFHPELTGRENIFMNGSVLGMSREEIICKLDDIMTFSEIGKFIDTPVKRYSSGMQVRLAFSVAIHLNTEILIVDEVLSAGDIAFQKKSMKAIKSLIDNNCTVIMVSHNIESVRNLCDKAIILHEGKMESCGDVQQQTSQYITKMQENEEVVPACRMWDLNEAPGNEIVKVISVGIKAKSKGFEESIYNEDELELNIEFQVQEKTTCLDVAFRIKDMSGYMLSGVISDRDPNEEMFGKYKAICLLPSHTFNEGRFFIDVRFLKQKIERKIFYMDSIIALTIDLNKDVVNIEAPKHPCPLKLKSKWELLNNNIIRS